MQQRLARFLAPWLVAQLLIASIGLPLHILHCYCDGSSEISLWAEAHECDADHQVGKALACCSTKQSATKACHQPATTGDQLTLQSSCGDVEQAFVRLQTEYSPLDARPVVPAAPLLAVVPALPMLPARPLLQTAETQPRFRYPPPPPTGRELRVRVQSFLC